MKIAIFGLGSIGQRHARNLAEMGEYDILGCDPRVGTEGFVTEGWVQAVSDADLVWQWNPDVVVICTPPPLHGDLAFAAIRRGAHCFIEKPLAHAQIVGREVSDYAAQCGKRLAVGYQLRFQLGRIPSGLDLTWDCSQDMSQWPSQYQKNVLLEFSHEIDAACYVNGPVRAVWAEEERCGWFVRLQHFSCVSTILINPQDKQACRDCYTPTFGRVWTFDRAQNDQAYKDELTAFISAVHDGSPFMDKRLCTGPQAAHILRIIEACQRSQQNYEVVQL